MTPNPLVDLELVVEARRRLERALTLVNRIEEAGRELEEFIADPDDPIAKLELTVGSEASTSHPAPPRPTPAPQAPAPVDETERRRRHAERSALGVSPESLDRVESYYRAHPDEWLKPGAVAVTLALSRVTGQRVHAELVKRDVLEHNERGTTARRYRLHPNLVDELVRPDPDTEPEPVPVNPDTEPEPAPEPDPPPPTGDGLVDDDADLADDDGHVDPDDETPFPELDDADEPPAAGQSERMGPTRILAPAGEMPSNMTLSPRTRKSIERAERDAATAPPNGNGRGAVAARILDSMLNGDGAGTITELARRLDIPRRDIAAGIAELEHDDAAGLCKAGKRDGNVVYTAVDE